MVRVMERQMKPRKGGKGWVEGMGALDRFYIG